MFCSMTFTWILPLLGACVMVFGLLFTSALGHRWSRHASTRFQSTWHWQNMQCSTSPDPSKLFPNCSVFWGTWQVLYFFEPTLPTSWAEGGFLRFDMLELFGGRGQECFGSDSWVVPGIRDPPQKWVPSEYHFLPKIEFQPNNGHLRDI